MYLDYFFFSSRRRHTRCSRDWSSDVCSSDLKESTGPAADYTLSLAPAALTIVQGATGNTTVTITRTNFTDAVTLSLGSAPTGVTGSFKPAAPTGGSATGTVRVGTSVVAGAFNQNVNGNGSPGNP